MREDTAVIEAENTIDKSDSCLFCIGIPYSSQVLSERKDNNVSFG